MASLGVVGLHPCQPRLCCTEAQVKIESPVENQPRLLQTRRLNFRSSKLVTLNGKPERTDFQPVGNSSRTLRTKL